MCVMSVCAHKCVVSISVCAHKCAMSVTVCAHKCVMSVTVWVCVHGLLFVVGWEFPRSWKGGSTSLMANGYQEK